MDQDLITDITLDHLPELSEESISFQIPSGNAHADLLLTSGLDILGDDDVSFTPVTLCHPRGPPLSLGELTPRVQVVSPSSHHSRSPTHTPLPSPSAKPSVTQRTLTLGHGSPHKSRKTPSPTKYIRRKLESPLVSSERFLQLRTEIETLSRVAESPTHVQSHVIVSEEDGSIDSSHVHSKTCGDVLAPPAREDLLVPISDEKDARQDDEPPEAVDRDLFMDTANSCPAEAKDVAVPAPLPKARRNPRTSTKPTVAAGGVSKRPILPKTRMTKKTKVKPCQAQEAQLVSACQPNSPHPTDAERELVPPACISGDNDFKSESTQITSPSTGGLAERLVSYSQKLLSSIGLSKPYPECSFPEVSDVATRVAETTVQTQLAAAVSPHCINEPHGEPFRLSELSPHKRPLASQPSSPAHTGLQHGMSPMRQAKKRVSTDADPPEDYHRRKRGRTIHADSHLERGSSKEAVSQGATGTAHAHEARSITHGDTSERRNSTQLTLPNARTKYKPKSTSSPACKGPTLTAFPYFSGSRQVHERLSKVKGKRDERQRKAATIRTGRSLSKLSASSGLRCEKRTRHENTIESSHVRQGSGPTSTVDLPLVEKKGNATLCVAQLTKPVGFTFRVDARLEARKGEGRLAVSEPGKTHVVPDVRAYRSSQPSATVSHRVGGVVPSVPVVPFFFCTEQRAKEREKFDDMVKRKEEEMERMKEEQRRREAEEEERAIKELRRKAIPKANEIPEWYADMPKRKGTAV